MSKNSSGNSSKQKPLQQSAGGGAQTAILHLLTSKSVRETVESIVVAFALAFLFRTFEAEAFVIPTGSMAPTLQGRHQDIDCPMCGFPYRVSASQEIDPHNEQKQADVIGGECSNCRYWACTNRRQGKLLGYPRPFNVGALDLDAESESANGDRIIVSKFAYAFQEPERWDVFVFRFPGNASRNYIKRLVGLPGETLKLHRGDVFRTEQIAENEAEARSLDYSVVRKPPHKAVAMAQLVHDNTYQADRLTQHGWPHRWDLWPRGVAPVKGDWEPTDDHRRFIIDGEGNATKTSWLRYQHRVPNFEQWNRIVEASETEDPTAKSRILQGVESVPQLIADAYSYNSGIVFQYPPQVQSNRVAMGMYWVGDLMLECRLEVLAARGSVQLDLVEGGKHFECTFNLETGVATLGIDGTFYDATGDPAKLPAAQTAVRGPGMYDLRFANFDDQLFLWVNGKSVAFDVPTTYPPQKNTIPISDTEEGGDLAPVGIGAAGASVAVDQLRILRDVYYISVPPDLSYTRSYIYGPLAADHYLGRAEVVSAAQKVLTDWRRWPEWFAQMHALYFPLERFGPSGAGKDQFFALGDNSPQSKDSRLWATPNTEYYVERDLLIGKALFIYWPLTHIDWVR
ncbi:MAG: signal peptidase I [Planctomycetota bacterium]|nr:signal peptidase I [Planctomycetota bacterium]